MRQIAARASCGATASIAASASATADSTVRTILLSASVSSPAVGSAPSKY